MGFSDWSTTKKLGVIGGGALALGVVGVLLYKVFKSPAEEGAETKVDEPTKVDSEPVASKDDAPSDPVKSPTNTVLPEATVLSILQDLHRHTQQLLMTIATMQQQAEERGENLPQDRLMKMFYERAEKIREVVLTRHGNVTEAALEASINSYPDNKKIKQLQEMLTQLVNAVSNNSGPMPEVEEDFTVDMFLEKLELFVKAVEQNLDRAVQEAQSTGKTGAELADEITNLVMMHAKEAQDAAFEKMGMTDKYFQACLKKFQGDPRVQEQFARLHENNTKRLSEVQQAR